jgi:hypothetical protein
MWKGLTMMCANLVSFSQGFGPLALVRTCAFAHLYVTANGTQAPMFGDYIEAFNSDLASVVQFTGVAILILGFSNFIWYFAPLH